MYIHYTYKITNNINGNEYIGIHSTKNLDDGYMGSGSILKKAFSKYGVERFRKEILKFHDTREELLEHEALLVDDAYVHRRDTYNMVRGGMEGFAPGSQAAINHGNFLREYYKDKANHPMYRKDVSEATRRRQSKAHKGKRVERLEGVLPWDNVRATDDTRVLWASLDTIKEVWESEGRCGYIRLGVLFDIQCDQGVFVNIIKRFNGGWDYKNDPDWVTFKSGWEGPTLTAMEPRQARKWEYPRARHDLWENADSYYDLKMVGLSAKEIMDIFNKEDIRCTRAQLYPIDEMIRGGWNPYEDTVWCLYQQGLTDGIPLTYFKK